MTTDNSLDGLLTRSEAAKFLKLSERTIGNLKLSGRLPVIRIGKSIRFALADLQAFVEANREGGDR